jgi:hypothetical protein
MRVNYERRDFLRRAALVRACRESAPRDAPLLPSRLRARDVACERLREVLAELLRLPLERSFFEDGVPAGGGASFTPALRALDSPIAIACLGERTPCLPSRTWWISSLTNSPACVLGALPWRASSRARSTVFFSGIVPAPALSTE